MSDKSKVSDDYFRCRKARGKEAPECQKLVKHYLASCPAELVNNNNKKTNTLSPMGKNETYNCVMFSDVNNLCRLIGGMHKWRTEPFPLGSD